MLLLSTLLAALPASRAATGLVIQAKPCLELSLSPESQSLLENADAEVEVLVKNCGLIRTGQITVNVNGIQGGCPRVIDTLAADAAYDFICKGSASGGTLYAEVDSDFKLQTKTALVRRVHPQVELALQRTAERFRIGDGGGSGTILATVTNLGDTPLKTAYVKMPGSVDCDPSGPITLQVGESKVVTCKVSAQEPIKSVMLATANAVEPETSYNVKSPERNAEIEFYAECDAYVPSKKTVVVLEGCSGAGRLVISKCKLGCIAGMVSEPRFSEGVCTVRKGKGALYDMVEPACGKQLGCPANSERLELKDFNDPTITRAACKCVSGYSGSITWDSTSGQWAGSCIDTDECREENGDCEHICVNTPGSYYCTCNAGYHLSKDGRNCDDDNECTDNNGGCEQICENFDGGFACSCRAGFTLVNKKQCMDDDECATKNGGCEQVCVNDIGSFHCECWLGFDMLNGVCTDEDECKMGTSKCQQGCSNTNGGYACSCANGFSLGSDAVSCNDVDECAFNNGGCTHFCANAVGGFTCSCKPGYTLGTDLHSCIDNDECALGTSGCQHICSNSPPGSFTCSCKEGYVLNPDGKTCKDVDECTEHVAKCQQLCLNNDGSFQCVCMAGYTLSPNGFACLDDNECTLNTHNCQHECHNTVGSFYCSCNNGYYLNPDKHSCVDIDECTPRNPCGPNALCKNLPGGFQCYCPEEYDPIPNSSPYACKKWNTCADIYGKQGGSGSTVTNCSDPFGNNAEQQGNPCGDSNAYSGDDVKCHLDCGKVDSKCCSSNIFDRLLDNHYFILDTSGSMDDRNKIIALKAEMKQIIEDMDANRTFNIVAFGSDVFEFASALVRAGDPGVRDNALTWVAGLRAGGYTQMYLALESFYRDPTAPGAFLVSDGNPKSKLGDSWIAMNTPPNIIKRAKEMKRVVNTIAIGPERGASVFLAQLACETKGTYRSVQPKK
eukprot:gb/GEZN01001003.1/.p1 GENE.gb/GEZN01001003.1/~~gb/GEZN01001003.1/.p1  ORF type:complete len:954 (-),score=80.00 gb/GEZN01001003.1/:491-3352(-)